MLVKQTVRLLPWLLEQSDDIKANTFAFYVAATLDSASGTDSVHAINAQCDVLDVDMTNYWTPTRETYLTPYRLYESATYRTLCSSDKRTV
jgi:ParB family chromosome partitioning protein